MKQRFWKTRLGSLRCLNQLILFFCLRSFVVTPLKLNDIFRCSYPFRKRDIILEIKCAQPQLVLSLIFHACLLPQTQSTNISLIYVVVASRQFVTIIGLSGGQFKEKWVISADRVLSASLIWNYGHWSPITNCVNNEVRETLELKIQHRGTYASYQYIIS